MSALYQRNKTFGELLTELKARLSFVAQGPSANNNNPVLTSFLQEGHDFIYQQLKPIPSRKKTVIDITAGSFLYDWHNDVEDEDIDPGKAISLWLIETPEQRTQLVQGITEFDRSSTSRGAPTRYDTLNGQIELWPVPDKKYGLLVEYVAEQPRFSQPNDRPGVPHRLVFLYALANAKAHYRHPDAEAAGATFARMLATAKVDQHENRRYIVGECRDEEQNVTGSDGSYHMRVR